MPHILSRKPCHSLQRLLTALTIFLFAIENLYFFASRYLWASTRIADGRPEVGYVATSSLCLVTFVLLYAVLVKVNLMFLSRLFPNVIALGELAGVLRRRVERAPPIVFHSVLSERARGQQRSVRDGTANNATAQVRYIELFVGVETSTSTRKTRANRCRSWSTFPFVYLATYFLRCCLHTYIQNRLTRHWWCAWTCGSRPTIRGGTGACMVIPLGCRRKLYNGGRASSFCGIGLR